MKITRKILLSLLFFNIAISEEKFVIGTIPSEGLFSSFLAALSSIIWAEKHHKIPVVHWTQDCCYAGTEAYNGSTNPWEYYFKPVSHLTYAPGDTSYAALCNPDGFSLYYNFCHQREQFSTQYRFVAKQAVDKYIQVQPSILEKVSSFYEANMAGKKTIGIHLRGTDKAGGQRNVILHSEEITSRKQRDLLRSQTQTLALMEAAEKAASETVGDIQFFIATDDESLLELAQTVSTRPIIYCDSHRSKDGSALHKFGSKRGGPIVGEEVLIEALLLAKCEFLAHSLSCVAISVLILNPDLKHEYVNTPYDNVRRKKL